MKKSEIEFSTQFLSFLFPPSKKKSECWLLLEKYAGCTVIKKLARKKYSLKDYLLSALPPLNFHLNFDESSL